MGNKIIRISKETHSAFKDLCIREKKGITEGAEIIISRTLKQGTLLDVKKNVFSQIQGLENTFRSWMKQQEKIHLRGIQEDLLILTGRLKDVATRTETEEVFKIGINQLCSISENSLEKYEEILHNHAESKIRFIKNLRHILITSLAAVGIYFFTMLIFNFVETIRLTKLDEIKNEYFALREYCRLVDEKEKENVNILSSFDEEWEKILNQP